MRKIAIVNLRHNIKINDKTGEMKSPVFMLKLVNICKKLLTKNMRIFDTNFERLQTNGRKNRRKNRGAALGTGPPDNEKSTKRSKHGTDSGNT